MSLRDYSGPLNPAALEALRLLDDDDSCSTSKQLIDIYITSSQTYLQRINSSLNPDTLREVAHTWKSSSMSVGAENLAMLCQSLEENSTDQTIVHEIIDRIKKEFSDVLLSLNSVYK